MRVLVLLLTTLVACARLDPPGPAPTPAPTVSVSVAPLPPPSTAPTPEPPNFSHVLGWWESTYSALDNRAKNIDRARSALDGARIAPGEELGFNAVVGPRTLERGYVFAPVISGGVTEQGVGGGVCQVSSTVYAAVLMAGLDVTRRTPHSRPSAYMPIGLDATVSIPSGCEGDTPSKTCYAPDLRFRNGEATPLMLHATVAPHATWKGYSVLRVEVLGAAEPGPRPTYSYGVRKTETFERKVRRVLGRSPGYKKRVQKGSAGAVVTGVLTTPLPDGTKSTRVLRSVYPPTDEVWEVGNDWSEDGNPWDVPASVDAGVPDGG